MIKEYDLRNMIRPIGFTRKISDRDFYEMSIRINDDQWVCVFITDEHFAQIAQQITSYQSQSSRRDDDLDWLAGTGYYAQ